jgi:O-antigen/teichoic acid export membrane protein
MHGMSVETSTAELIVTKAVHGQRTMLHSHLVRALCKVVSVLVLARLVGPADQGLFAMAASITLLLTYFRDFGLGVAAIQARELSEDQRTSLWWIHVVLGCALAIATIALIPAIISFYREPRLGPLLASMSASFIFMGISAWPRVLLARDLEFAAINRAETIAVLTATLAMVVAGFLGWGAFAFVAFLLVVEAVTAVLSWRACAWRPRGITGWRYVRPLLRTGLDVVGYNLLLHVSQQLDTLLIGKWFGPRSLGLYFRSGQLLQMPAQHVATPLAQVMLASLSRLRPTAPEFREHVRTTTTLVLHLSLPLTVYCAVLPDDVARFVLGRDWLAAAPFLRWMAFSAAFAAMTATGYSLNIATGHTRRLAGLALLALCANLSALVFARPFGATNVALALAATNLVLLVPRLSWLAHDTPIRLSDFVSSFSGPVAVAGAMALGFAGAALSSRLEPGCARLAAATLGGTITVGALCVLWTRPRRELLEVWAHRPRWHGFSSFRTTS